MCFVNVFLEFFFETPAISRLPVNAKNMRLNIGVKNKITLFLVFDHSSFPITHKVGIFVLREFCK